MSEDMADYTPDNNLPDVDLELALDSDPALERALTSILEEMCRQRVDWRKEIDLGAYPDLDYDSVLEPWWWSSTLLDACNEVEEIVDEGLNRPSRMEFDDADGRRVYRQKLVTLAATALRAMLDFDREEARG